MINWRKVANDNGLSTEEFRDEIFSSALALGMMELDGKEFNTMKWSNDDGVVIVTIPPKGDTE
tara:strand:+ start:406 stop:594 length:189 start_codon:yes stop_codon:yes gene_type:complete